MARNPTQFTTIRPAQLDADLLAIIEAWPTLLTTVRATVLALIGRDS